MQTDYGIFKDSDMTSIVSKKMQYIFIFQHFNFGSVCVCVFSQA